jgi:hypothetical protein
VHAGQPAPLRNRSVAEIAELEASVRDYAMDTGKVILQLV